MARVHDMRSAMISLVAADDSGLVALGSEYLDFGKVDLTDVVTGRRYLLKARSTVNRSGVIEPTLFDLEDAVSVLLYSFENSNLVLEAAPVALTRTGDRVRISLLGAIELLGKWPLNGDSDDSGTTFDQGSKDKFDDLGDIGETGDGFQ